MIDKTKKIIKIGDLISYLKLEPKDFQNGVYVDHGNDILEYKGFHENGNLWEHCWYKNGKLNGEYKLFHKNGNLLEHCWYKNGERDGEYRWFRENGNLLEHCWYKNGIIVKKIL